MVDPGGGRRSAPRRRLGTERGGMAVPDDIPGHDGPIRADGRVDDGEVRNVGADVLWWFVVGHCAAVGLHSGSWCDGYLDFALCEECPGQIP